MFEDRSSNGRSTVAAGPADVRRTEACETYLATPRALIACAREFDRLTAEVAEHANMLGDVMAGETKADVKRAPGRCIVQAGPVALTMSWVRAKVDSAADGRLLVIEWEGTVGGRPPRSTAPATVGRVGATILREDVFVADATADQDWTWRAEDTAYGSKQLALHYVESLRTHLVGRTA